MDAEQLKKQKAREYEQQEYRKEARRIASRKLCREKKLISTASLFGELTLEELIIVTMIRCKDIGVDFEENQNILVGAMQILNSSPKDPGNTLVSNMCGAQLLSIAKIQTMRDVKLMEEIMGNIKHQLNLKQVRALHGTYVSSGIRGNFSKAMDDLGLHADSDWRVVPEANAQRRFDVNHALQQLKNVSGSPMTCANHCDYTFIHNVMIHIRDLMVQYEKARAGDENYFQFVPIFANMQKITFTDFNEASDKCPYHNTKTHTHDYCTDLHSQNRLGPHLKLKVE